MFQRMSLPKQEFKKQMVLIKKNPQEALWGADKIIWRSGRKYEQKKKEKK